MEIEMIPVDSSNLQAIGYDGLGQKLRAQFKSGAVYEYSQVTAETWDNLMHAPSKGKFFADQIAKRDAAKFPVTRVS